MTATNTLTSIFTAIANAIRGKNGLQTQYRPDQMAAAITNLPSGGTDYLAERLNGTLTSYSSNDVTSVAQYAFYQCASLLSISLQNAVSVGNQAFVHCANLVSAYLPSATSLGTFVFQSATRLTSVTLGNITSIPEGTFHGCTAFDGSGINFANLTSIGKSAFYNTAITELISSSAFSYIGAQAFSNCTQLTTVDLPNTNSSEFSNIFSGCTALRSVNMPKQQVISQMCFQNCTALTELEFDACTRFNGSAYNYSPIDGCSNLIQLTLGRNIREIRGCGSAYYALMRGCTSMERLILKATTPPSIGGGYLYSNTQGDVPPNFDGIYVPDASVATYKAASNWSLYSAYIKPMSEL